MNLRQILTIVFLCCCLNVFGQQPNKITLQGVNKQVQVVQDSLETAINSSGDVIFCATAEYREWKKQGKDLPF